MRLPALHRLIEQFTAAARFCIAVLTAAVLVSGLSAPMTAYADLPNCGQAVRHALHQTPSQRHDTSSSATQTNHAAVDTRIEPDGCCGYCSQCGYCDGCDNYFDAHFDGLVLLHSADSTSAPADAFVDVIVHTMQVSHRPDFPPPRRV